MRTWIEAAISTMPGILAQTNQLDRGFKYGSLSCYRGHEKFTNDTIQSDHWIHFWAGFFFLPKLKVFKAKEWSPHLFKNKTSL